MKFRNTVTGKQDTAFWKALELDLTCQRVISFVGAGGKTTLIYVLAEELAAMGYRVLVTTTTHMKKPEQNYREWGSGIKIEHGQALTVGVSCEDGKIRGIEEETYGKFFESADFIIIEADGSKGMPLKVPAGHEPVLPEETDLVVGVLGFQSVGKTICETAHRIADVAAFLKKEKTDMVTVQDLETISFSKNGLMKNVHTSYRVIWNQWKREEAALTKKYPILLCEWEKMW